MSLLPNKTEPTLQYYNIEIPGSNISDTKAIFNINRSDFIVENPSDYYIAIESFSVPLISVPLFIFQDDNYNFQLEYDGLILTKNLVYTPEGNLNNNYVYSYQGMINSMNVALKSLYDDMLVAKPLFPPTEQLFITLKNNLISINWQDSYLTSGVKLYCNDALYEFLRSINIFYFNNTKIQLLVNDTYPTYIRNSITYYQATQATQEIENWSRLESILFSTSTVPVSSQFIGSQANITINVLGDYYRVPRVNRPSIFTFNTTGPTPLIDLNSSYPMSNVDVQIRFFFNDLTSDIIIVPYSTTCYVKLVLVKRLEESLNNLDETGLLMFS
jgi:hypothetical protein